MSVVEGDQALDLCLICADLRVQGLSQKSEQGLIIGTRKAETFVVEDPIVFPVAIRGAMLEDVSQRVGVDQPSALRLDSGRHCLGWPRHVDNPLHN
jgi:hypothetical protein